VSVGTEDHVLSWLGTDPGPVFPDRGLSYWKLRPTGRYCHKLVKRFISRTFESQWLEVQWLEFCVGWTLFIVPGIILFLFTVSIIPLWYIMLYSNVTCNSLNARTFVKTGQHDLKLFLIHNCIHNYYFVYFRSIYSRWIFWNICGLGKQWVRRRI